MLSRARQLVPKLGLSVCVRPGAAATTTAPLSPRLDMPRVVINCGAPSADADESAASGRWALKSNPNERKVWVERGDGSARKIVFSSTFDAVLTAEADGSEQLHEAALSAAVATCLEGKLGIVVCVGSDADQRAATLRALPKLATWSR